MSQSIDVGEQRLSVTARPHTPATPPYATLDDWEQAKAAVHAAGDRMARMIADTLRAMFPTAAYLVLYRGEYDDELHPHSIRDEHGGILWDFPGFPGFEPFPLTIPDGPLRAAWGDKDPQTPGHLAGLVLSLDAFGCGFDTVPNDLPFHGDDPDQCEPCLLLSDRARPGVWDFGRVMRPYSAARPDGA
ncbi:hypothetical protein [Streptomyces sp. NPDC047525]|uniref:hypothetical protein n=1 Tax=Streptomyces sp. NPDC047525 TaxID=3155264 RepID=UPI0033C98CF0